ncbi:hypothetical protein IA54_015560 [Xanthomonas phaseoli pv. syngonii LMG 9055]|uniref:Uncharacterized protein n=1 Tax=Xanthomonas phaseoli pv. syngonii LMG 9055 TaxID=1437878 RepID=A0A1V9GK95_9XANT|nr:hypothetical protein IA54_015560 [Xanthomonas phaseoli pv. syngonii LMG 9055]
MTRATCRPGSTEPPGRALTLEELSLRETLFLAALLRAQDLRVQVAPTRQSTLTVLDVLRGQALIQVPWPADRWPIRPDAEVTPLEDIQWAFAWASYEREHLLPALEDRLIELSAEQDLAAQRHAIWSELALWEAEQFLEQQLRKHHFDPAWARDLSFIFRVALPGLPIARWRYCCWAAVRQGASVALRQSAPDVSGVREAIFAELQKRLHYVTHGANQLGVFTPFQPLPSSALAQLFVTHVIPMVWDYWTADRSVSLS